MKPEQPCVEEEGRATPASPASPPLSVHPPTNGFKKLLEGYIRQRDAAAAAASLPLSSPKLGEIQAALRTKRPNT